MVLYAILASPSGTLAWVTRPTIHLVATPTTCTIRPTRLYMFDWFNPKPKPKPEEKQQPQQDSSAASISVDDTQVNQVIPSLTTNAATAATVAVTSNDHKTALSSSPMSLSDTIHSGTVAWFDRKKGFGFIKSSDENNKESVFVHQSQIQMDGYRCLVDGEQVEYRLEHDDKGRARATHVTGPNGGDVKTSKRRNERATTS